MAESAVIGYSHDIKGQGEQETFLSVFKKKKKSYAVLGGRTSKKGHFSLSALSGVYAYVVLKKGVDLQEMDLHQQLNDAVSKKIAKYACPDYIQVILPPWFSMKTRNPRRPYTMSLRHHFLGLFSQVVGHLPKTRSGKIMRRILQKVAEQDLNGLGDISTLDDSAAVQEIIKGRRDLFAKLQRS